MMADTGWFVFGMVCLVLYLLQVLLAWLAAAGWATERQELYSRLQAGTLVDYARHRPEEDAHKGKGPPMGEQETIEELTALKETMPDGAYTDAQSAFDKLMSE